MLFTGIILIALGSAICLSTITRNQQHTQPQFGDIVLYTGPIFSRHGRESG